MAKAGADGRENAPLPSLFAGQRSGGRAFAIYNGLRLGLLAVALGVGWLAGLRGPVWLIVGLAVSGVASWFLLKRQRIAMGEAVENTVSRSRDRMAAWTASEDDYLDSLDAQTPVEDPASSTPKP